MDYQTLATSLCSHYINLGLSNRIILVERPPCDREVAGSIHSRVIPKTYKMVLAALSLGAQRYKSRAGNQNWSAQCQYNVAGWNIMSSIWGVIFQ